MRQLAAPSRRASRASAIGSRIVSVYRVHDHTGDDLGSLDHPAPNLEAGDVVMLEDGREALVTARVETASGLVAALLEVVVSSEADTAKD